MFDNHPRRVTWQLVVGDHSATGRQTVGDRSANSRIDQFSRIKTFWLEIGCSIVADGCRLRLGRSTGYSLILRCILNMWLHRCTTTTNPIGRSDINGTSRPIKIRHINSCSSPFNVYLTRNDAI